MWLERPNAEAIAGMEAADRGEVVTVDTVEEFFEQLHRED
jgi:predicted transcriptional regulator